MTIESASEQADNSSRAIPVAVVGSPSTNTELTLDILDSSTNARLVGALVGFTWSQSEPPQSEDSPLAAVLGQITSVEMRNRWHEDQTFKNIIKSNNVLPSITPAQDTRTAVMKVGGCFVRNPDGTYSHGDIGSVPSTGTNVNLVQQHFLDSVLAFCKEDLFMLGRAYGSPVAFPMWFKHFGSGIHGVGEAYHIGIFGKTGSGKTGLAKMLLTAYARHTSMGILIIDPQGEFSIEMSGNTVGQQELDLVDILENRLNRHIIRLPISKIRLDSWKLFEELLVGSRFFDVELGVRGETQRFAAINSLMRELRRNYRIDQLMTETCARSILNVLQKNAKRIYSSPPFAEKLRNDIDELTGAGFGEFYRRLWQPITELFNSGPDKLGLNDIVRRLVESGNRNKPVVVVDLSSQSGIQLWSETLQNRVISHLAAAIIAESSKTLGESENTANTLIILDEAHRFVPSGGESQLDDQTRELRSELKRAVRETRKYGVGWMFISQTMQGLDMEILMQLRAMFLGHGLAFGLEFQRLRDLAGGDEESMTLYRSFRDPQSAIDMRSKEFPFMAIGPISPMPFSGKPIFFSAFDGREFSNSNTLNPFSEP